MTLSVNDLTKLPDDELYFYIRLIVGYRLSGLPLDYLVGMSVLSRPAVQRILLDNGIVPMRGGRRHWGGSYEVTAAMFEALALPAYLPLRSEGASWGAGERDENGTRVHLEFPPVHTVPPLDR